MLLEGVSPDTMSFVSERIPTDEASILELIMLVSSIDQEVTREAILERLEYAETHEKEHILELLDLRLLMNMVLLRKNLLIL